MLAALESRLVMCALCLAPVVAKQRRLVMQLDLGLRS